MFNTRKKVLHFSTNVFGYYRISKDDSLYLVQLLIMCEKTVSFQLLLKTTPHFLQLSATGNQVCTPFRSFTYFTWYVLQNYRETSNCGIKTDLGQQKSLSSLLHLLLSLEKLKTRRAAIWGFQSSYWVIENFYEGMILWKGDAFIHTNAHVVQLVSVNWSYSNSIASLGADESQFSLLSYSNL